MKQDSVIFQPLETVRGWDGQTIETMAIRKMKYWLSLKNQLWNIK